MEKKLKTQHAILAKKQEKMKEIKFMTSASIRGSLNNSTLLQNLLFFILTKCLSEYLLFGWVLI